MIAHHAIQTAIHVHRVAKPLRVAHASMAHAAKHWRKLRRHKLPRRVKPSQNVVHALKVKKHVAHGRSVRKAVANNAARAPLIMIETIAAHARSVLKA